MPSISKQIASQSSTRDAYWDLVKALLILLVTWGHCIQFLQFPGSVAFWESPYFKGIYLFHMPLFIGISGYFAAASMRKRGKDSLCRYAYRLLIPCITYGFIHMGMEWCFHRPISPLLLTFSILWFLIVVFESVGLYYLLRRFSGIINRAWQFIFPPFFVTALCTCWPDCFPCSTQFAYLWPFFLGGAILNEHGFTAQHISKKLAVLFLPIIPFAFIVSSQLFVYVTPLKFSPAALGYALARTCIAAMLCAGFLGVVQCIRGAARYPIVKKIGRCTLALYVFQAFLCPFLKLALSHGNNGLSDMETCALSLLIFLTLYILYVLLSKIPLLPFLLFGERK